MNLISNFVSTFLLFTWCVILLFLQKVFSTLTAWDYYILLYKPSSFCLSWLWAPFYFEFPHKLRKSLLEGLCCVTLCKRFIWQDKQCLEGNIWNRTWVFMEENFRLFPSIFFKYFPSSLYLITVNADKINSLWNTFFIYTYKHFYCNWKKHITKYNGKITFISNFSKVDSVLISP